jgi:hypothetical protein
MVTKVRPDFNAQRMAGQRYYDRWKALQADGVRPFVLSRSAHPQQWQAWRAFYRARGLWAMLEIMDDGRPEKTVPTLDPADFEPAEVQPDRRVKDD